MTGKPLSSLPLTLTLAMLAACSSKPQASSGPTQTLEDFVLDQSTDGRPAWKLRSSLAVVAELDREITLETPRMELYQEGRVVSRIQSLKGVVAMDGSEILLSSAVVVTSPQERTTLKTERLRYSSSKKKLWTDDEVFVERPGAKLRGTGLEADPALTEVRVHNQRAVIQ